MHRVGGDTAGLYSIVQRRKKSVCCVNSAIIQFQGMHLKDVMNEMGKDGGFGNKPMNNNLFPDPVSMLYFFG